MKIFGAAWVAGGLRRVDELVRGYRPCHPDSFIQSGLFYGEVDDTKSLATLNHCLDVGVTFIDTANVYGGGDKPGIPPNSSNRRTTRCRAPGLPT